MASSRSEVVRALAVAGVVAISACGGAGGPGPSSPEPSARDGAAPDPASAVQASPGEKASGAEARRDSSVASPPSGDTDAGDGPGAEPEAPSPEPVSAPEPAPAPPPLSTLPVPILPGALLPQTRIVAFYGNPASTRMGILGEVPPDEMLRRLDAEVRAWKEADPLTPVRPALQIIAVMATGDPGPDSLFRLRMPESRIRQVADWADRRDALLFLDVQPGRSNVAAEVRPLEPWLARPDVHLALDPEWAMPPDGIPGTRIGSMRADDINHAIDFLADIVDRYSLPPKVLVVHRFTQSMIQGAHRIRRDPRVQVVINMDGWGHPANKRAAYRDVVAPEADQYTGFKLFFHNDLRDGSSLLTPDEILRLDPPPSYIQYQ